MASPAIGAGLAIIAVTIIAVEIGKAAARSQNCDKWKKDKDNYDRERQKAGNDPVAINFCENTLNPGPPPKDCGCTGAK